MLQIHGTDRRFEHWRSRKRVQHIYKEVNSAYDKTTRPSDGDCAYERPRLRAEGPGASSPSSPEAGGRVVPCA